MRAGIRGKLLGSFGLVLGLLALVVALGLYQLGLATRALHDVADDEVAGLTATFEIRAASLSLQRDLRALVLAFTPDEKQKIKVSQEATDKVFREQMAKLDAALESPEERQAFDKLQAANKLWAEVRKTITESALAGDQLTSRTTLNGEDNQKAVPYSL